jgi:hypothetical protein
MRIRVPQMIQDPELSKVDVGRLVEDWTMLDEDHYLDGPITPRVAVVDLDPNTERLEAGAVYQPPTRNQTFGRYDVNRDDVTSNSFIQASVFATVYRTIYLYEQRQTLGRKINWAFGAPQLLVVPRAGWLPNAYYERRSRSLQFFSFVAATDAGDEKVVHTSLSRDIVAHETAHAIIDGIDPDLYDALDPQALALHEGIADLTAMLLAFSSGRLREAILNKTGGSIENSTAFSSIGEQFGKALDRSGNATSLRDLKNTKVLDPKEPEPEIHELSEVISGVLYGFMCVLHAHFKKLLSEKWGVDEFSASGAALDIAGKQFGRTVLRGLDYMPPGEVTFADFGRAILAADQASFADDAWRRWLRKNFVQRGIVSKESVLDVTTNCEHPAVQGANLQGLVDSEWVAYSFADENRDLLGIPIDAQFEVLKRVVVDGRFETSEEGMKRHEKKRDTKLAGSAASPTAANEAEDDEDGDVAGSADPGVPFRELLFKVRWSQVEDNPADIGDKRRIQTGTTLVIDWNAKRIRSLLGPVNLKERQTARDTMFRSLLESGVVEVIEPDEKAHGKALTSGIDAIVTDGITRIRNTARLLHIVREIDE